MISTERVCDLFVEVADTLADEFDVVDFLHDLSVPVATVSGAQAAGLLLTDRTGRLRLMAASDPGGETTELWVASRRLVRPRPPLDTRSTSASGRGGP